MTIYLHIGSPKTGTTSFQNFCAARREQLLGSGILYPLALGKIAHTGAPLYAADFSDGFSAKRLKVLTSESALEKYRETIRKNLYDEVTRSGSPHLLVSSEHLYVSVVEEREIARLRDLFLPLQQDLKILVYLRRRDDFALSLYAEAVRMGYAGSLDEYMRHQRTVRMLDYSTILRRWANVFGKPNVVLRTYDRDNLYAGDVISDILNQIGAPTDLAKAKDSQRMRESLGGDALDFLVRFNGAVNKLLKDDPGVTLGHFRSTRIRESLVEALEKGSNGSKLRIADDVRQRIFGRYREADESLFAEFGQRMAEKKGAPAQPERGAELSLEAAIEFAARLWINRERTLLELDPNYMIQLQIDEEVSPVPRQAFAN